VSDQIFQAILVPLLSSLVGAFVVYVFAVRKHLVERRASYLEKQLAEFYSPLAGYHKRIRAMSVLRGQIQNAADKSWRELCERYSQAQQIMHDHEEQFAPYRNLIEHDNQQFRDELFPLYRKMLDIFTDNY
jgi:hypothetical protein